MSPSRTAEGRDRAIRVHDDRAFQGSRPWVARPYIGVAHHDGLLVIVRTDVRSCILDLAHVWPRALEIGCFDSARGSSPSDNPPPRPEASVYTRRKP